MGNRYQKYKKQDGARPSFSKSGTGTFWATLSERLGIGPGDERSTNNVPGTGAGYQPQSSYEDDDGDRIIRHRQNSRFDPVTGTYIAQDIEPPRKRNVWLWIVLAAAAIILLSFVFSPRDAVKVAPPANAPVVDAIANANTPKENVKQNTATANNASVPTPRPSPTATKTPDLSPTPAPTENSSMLQYGSKGEAVKNLQGQLISLGYIALGKDDGAFGDVTQDAVLSFQKVNSLEADGIAGEKTLALLNSGTAKQDPDVFVWVVDKGKAYHSNKDCSDMKNPKQIKLSLAEKRKLKACEKCH